MKFKEHKWKSMGRNSVKFELIVRDQDFKKLETKKFLKGNFKETIKDIKNRYGIEKSEKDSSKEVSNELAFLKESGIL